MTTTTTTTPAPAVRGMGARCDTFWGSHGCDKPGGHHAAGDPVHVCGVDDPEGFCSAAEIDGAGIAHVRFYEPDRPLLGEKVYLMAAMRAGGREWTP